MSDVRVSKFFKDRFDDSAWLNTIIKIAAINQLAASLTSTYHKISFSTFSYQHRIIISVPHYELRYAIIHYWMREEVIVAAFQFHCTMEGEYSASCVFPKIGWNLKRERERESQRGNKLGIPYISNAFFYNSRKKNMFCTQNYMLNIVFFRLVCKTYCICVLAKR